MTPKKGETFTLDELQKYVGGFVELLFFGEREAMVVNEDGKALNLPVNPTATTKWRMRSLSMDEIRGDVVVVSMDEMPH